MVLLDPCPESIWYLMKRGLCQVWWRMLTIALGRLSQQGTYLRLIWATGFQKEVTEFGYGQ